MTPITDFSQAARLDNWTMQHPSLEGFAAARRNASAQQERRIREAARLYADVLRGREHPLMLQEAMRPSNELFVSHLMERYPGLYGDPGGRTLGLRETMAVTDYQALTVDVLDRLYYGWYNSYPIPNKSLVKIKTLRDFRTVKRYMLDGVVSPLTSSDPGAQIPNRSLLGPTPQDGTSPPTPSTSTAAVTYSPLLYQAMTSVNWSAIVDDDLGIFQDLAQRLAISGNQGVNKFITGQYVDANGPNASLYTAGYGNIINTANGASINNPPLSAQGIMDAMKILAGMRDSAGYPIMITGRLRCWYGPSLTAVAQNLKRALTISLSVEGGNQAGTTGFPSQWLQVANWINDMDLVMDPFIPIVCTTGGVQHTMWGITVDPDSQNRPAIEVGFLQGYETPQTFSRVPTTQRVGGGVDPMLGDFFTMNQDLKIMTVMGGTQIDGRSTVASTGQSV